MATLVHIGGSRLHVRLGGGIAKVYNPANVPRRCSSGPNIGLVSTTGPKLPLDHKMCWLGATRFDLLWCGCDQVWAESAWYRRNQGRLNPIWAGFGETYVSVAGDAFDHTCSGFSQAQGSDLQPTCLPTSGWCDQD